MRNKVFRYYEHYMYLMGFAGHLIFVFQALKIWQTKSSYDVSLLGFLSCFWAVCSWLIYGILINNRLLIRVNIFGVTTGLFCLMMILIYKN